MKNSIGRLRLFLAAGIVVALLPLGVAEAKNWKPGDPGSCPGTLDTKTLKCKRPYLCEPTQCYGCVRILGNEEKCVQCGAFNSPECKVQRDRGGVKLPSASNANAPSTPADETGTGRYKPATSLGVHHTQ